VSVEHFDGVELRRSRRLALRLPVQVRWTPHGELPISEETTTLVVNAHGALILLAMRVKAGDRIVLRNRVGTQNKECRVVRVGAKPAAKSEVAVEFLRADAQFWGLELVPDDWKQFTG
jgi:hypothetical protein